MRVEKKILRSSLPDVTNDLSDQLHPVLRRIYALRGLTSSKELDMGLEQMLTPDNLGGTKEAAILLFSAIKEGKKIIIVADFDADGATSCALAIKALRAMGAQQVDYLVPNRFEYGYGLTPEIVEEALKRKPDLLVTVDNGISSIQGVKRAKAAGMQVLITDHHLPGRTLPDADVIVNPNNPGESFSSKNLAGVGVIFYLMVALRKLLRSEAWFKQKGIQEPNLAALLDLVALGTVADVVPLDHNNRILVYQGLQRIRSGHCCEGIKALFERSGRNLQRVVASDLGFAIGPRLNAAGRLDDMSIGIECLLTEDATVAFELARSLDELNRERRQIENEMRQQAVGDIETLIPDGDLPFGLAIFREDWHQGVIGILAARIRERFHRPVIAFAPAEEGMIKGSARSIPGLHIRDALDAIATRYPELLEKFGGHAMAAGLSLRRTDFDAFKDQFDAQVRESIDAEGLNGVILSDGALDCRDLSFQLAELLRSSGPWGQGFPEPLFDGVFRIVSLRVVGERHLKMVLEPEDGGQRVDAIAFNQVENQSGNGNEKLHIAYRLDINEFRGTRKLQLIVEHFEKVLE
ncbi:single-stranded-DNA-specific exonuclease RecJ [Candidatus Vondammii sp. HM_W22]|uniref:single-stranded-DNA-specific exonuclease RecJ n=1 Tax=Candidatus Vondammii sp. HM_W22 TaxID=2687299 RepID=UPI001F12BF82|nr:single-stranded-DNA-specific exonuclease RecJ [Candidatus Vondammii sp. HM_W22]